MQQTASDLFLKHNNIALTVVISTLCCMMMIAFFYLLYIKFRKRLEQEQNEALKNLIKGQETERERLARDIHDDMGPELSLLLLTVDSMDTINPVQEETKAEIKTKLREAISHIRSISHNLMPPVLAKHGLIPAVEELVSSSRKYGPSFHFNTNCTYRQFDHETETNIYRIIEELIYNSIKHANAKNINISLILTPESGITTLGYSDDGVGMDMGKASNGIGINNIRSRVKMLNGILELSSVNGLQYSIKLKNSAA